MARPVGQGSQRASSTKQTRATRAATRKNGKSSVEDDSQAKNGASRPRRSTRSTFTDPSPKNRNPPRATRGNRKPVEPSSESEESGEASFDESSGGEESEISSENEETSSKKRNIRPKRGARNRFVEASSSEDSGGEEEEVSAQNGSDDESEGADSESEPEETPVKRSSRNLRRRPGAANGRRGTAHVENSQSEEEESSDENTKNSDDIESNENESSSEVNDDGESEEEAQSPPKARRATKKQSQIDPRAGYYFIKDHDLKKLRHEESLARFKYLLGLGDLFRQFVDYRAQKDDDFRKLLDQAQKENDKARRASLRGPKKGRSRKPITSGEDPAEAAGIEDEKITVFSESPGFINGKLRQYQIDGLNWLISLFVNKINGILADEMGLGKTLQCISFLTYLRHIQNITGPHLVIIPKSTLQNWAREFAKWTPDTEVLLITGSKEERADLIRDRLLTCKFDVCITSFELVIREKSALQKIAWEYVIVDEAHRIKNEESILSKIMRVLFSRHRLLITGTPLQNNLHELWALLNFLLPDVFSDADVFDEWFTQHEEEGEEEEKEEKGPEKGRKSSQGQLERTGKNKEPNGDTQNGSQNEDSDDLVNQLRLLLSPFLLRRVKNDVEHTLLPKKEINLYSPMTEMQLEWYQRLLLKDLDAVNTNKGGAGRDGKMRLLNVVMQLRKCCNHPYLFEGAEPGPPFTTDEHLVQNSSKMLILDKLLAHLKKQGSRVLIFSQMSRMLDILEDFCSLRDYNYCRIDGSTLHEDRVRAIDEYNKPGSDKFVFLLTTRAGGLGINLTTADQVIIYDSDWNPQADLQAMDRAHRIGQMKQVWVYRLVIENAIEEKILERAAHKLRLDQLVIQQSGSGKAKSAEKAANAREELANMIRHGAQDVFDQKMNTSSADFNIADVIAAGEVRTKQLNDKYSDLGLDELQKFTFDKPPSNQLQVSNNLQKSANEEEFRHHHRRARNHAVFHEEATIADIDGKPVKTAPLRAPKQLPLHDFQFYPPELADLQARELASYRKFAGIRLSPEDYSSDEEDDSEQRNEEIENAEPLSEEDYAYKEELISQGFPNFTKRDFYHFISLLSTNEDSQNLSEEALNELCENWPEKSAEEIKRYYKVFFERYREIGDHERYMNQIAAGGNKAKKNSLRVELLKKRIGSTANPLSDMPVSQPTGGSSSRYRFSVPNDRFMLLELAKIGIETPDVYQTIHSRIRTCGLFDFDWYFMSRSPTEIGRRCSSLLNIISRENDGTIVPKGTKRKGRPPNSQKETKNKRVKDESVSLD